MKRKIISLICCILMLAGMLVFTGCGGSGGSSGTSISGSGE